MDDFGEEATLLSHPGLICYARCEILDDCCCEDIKIFLLKHVQGGPAD